MQIMYVGVWLWVGRSVGRSGGHHVVFGHVTTGWTHSRGIYAWQGSLELVRLFERVHLCTRTRATTCFVPHDFQHR